MNNQVDLRIFNPYKVDGLQRIGSTNDGGYIIHYPSLLTADCLVNYGVGYNVEFEKEFNKVTGKPVYAFDPTMKKLSYFIDGIKRGDYFITSKQIVKLMLWLVKEKSLPKHQIHFIEEGISDHNTGDFKTYEYHLTKYNLLDKKIFLKIDIEGTEYDILKDRSFYNHLDNVVQIVLEFHYLDKKMPELEHIFKNMQPTHSLIHIHGNNNGGTFIYDGKTIPEVIEVVFIHNSLVHEKVFSQQNYPIEGLDFPCNWRRKDIPLDFFK